MVPGKCKTTTHKPRKKTNHNHSFSFSSAGSFCPSLSLRQGRKTVQETSYYSFSTKNTENASTFHLQGDQSSVYRHRLMDLIQPYSQTGIHHFLHNTAVGASVETELRAFVCFSADSIAANKIIRTLVFGHWPGNEGTLHRHITFNWLKRKDVPRVQLTHNGDFLTIITLKRGENKQEGCFEDGPTAAVQEIVETLCGSHEDNRQ